MKIQAAKDLVTPFAEACQQVDAHYSKYVSRLLGSAEIQLIHAKKLQEAEAVLDGATATLHLHTEAQLLGIDVQEYAQRIFDKHNETNKKLVHAECLRLTTKRELSLVVDPDNFNELVRSFVGSLSA